LTTRPHTPHSRHVMAGDTLTTNRTRRHQVAAARSHTQARANQ
jgi:hypothetical protein